MWCRMLYWTRTVPRLLGQTRSCFSPAEPSTEQRGYLFFKNEPFASLPPHQDEPDDSDDDQKYFACCDYRLSVHGQPP